MSLQAMVFCKHPFFNEPGHACQAGSANGDGASRMYNDQVVAMTAKHAILAPLQNPSGHPHAVFRGVLARHWRAKAADIREHLAPSPHLAAISAQLDKL